MEIDFELIKPYIVWATVVVITFGATTLITTNVFRKILQMKINKKFPIIEGPMSEEQVKLLLKKANYDIKILKKDLQEWKDLREEQKLTHCKYLINMIEEMKYLTNYKLLTPEQIRNINEYMLKKKPVWEETEAPSYKRAI